MGWEGGLEFAPAEGVGVFNCAAAAGGGPPPAAVAVASESGERVRTNQLRSVSLGAGVEGAHATKHGLIALRVREQVPDRGRDEGPGAVPKGRVTGETILFPD